MEQPPLKTYDLTLKSLKLFDFKLSYNEVYHMPIKCSYCATLVHHCAKFAKLY